MIVFSEKVYNYLLMPNFHRLIMLVTMIFIISGLNLISDNDYSFAQVNASSPSSLSNNSQQTQESLGSTNRDAILSYEQGNKFLNAKNYDQAITSYKNAITFDPNWAAPLIKQGNAFFELANYTTAVELYDKATELKPTWAKPWNSKGWALYKIGKFDEALSSFDKAIALEPKWDKPWFNKGKILYQLENYSDSKQFVEHALSLKADPKTSALLESINAKIQQTS